MIVEFFYSARGGDDQQGHIWMLRSILYQLLLQVPGLWADYREGFGEFRQSAAWDLKSLQQIFSNLGTKYDRQIPLISFIIVDAMDESEESRRQEIVQMLQNATKNNATSIIFKIFVASRPNTKIAHILRNCHYMKLEDETHGDVVEYVNAETKRIAVDILNRDSSDIRFVAEELIRRSKGVFLWVKLVLTELEENAMDGICSLAEIEELMQSIPSDLEDLYARIITKIDRGSQAATRECQTLLRWAAFSPKPLEVEVMIEVLAATSCGNSSISEKELKRHRVGNAEDLQRRIISRCGNLLEVQDGIVQFIHQTVREYVLTKMKSANISVARAASELEIASQCKYYLDFINSVVEESLSRYSAKTFLWETMVNNCVGLFKMPSLLPYCLKTYHSHADRALEESFTLPEELEVVFRNFLESVSSTLKLMEIITVVALIRDMPAAIDTIIRYVEQTDRLVTIYILNDGQTITPFQSYNSPMTSHHWSLLQISAFLGGRCIGNLLVSGLDPNFRNDMGQTPLFQAAERGDAWTAYRLVNSENEDFNEEKSISRASDFPSVAEQVSSDEHVFSGERVSDERVSD